MNPDDTIPPHELVFLSLGDVPKRGIHISARARDAIEDEIARTGLPVMAIVREAIENGVRVRRAM